ncbi:MAG: tRNA glutamyl-Q(34) synthetase GluQRS [Neisseria sp.]|nr:tRNA glutamyl-Q(34) synthetase GluQRS [Neisseria sp.]
MNNSFNKNAQYIGRFAPSPTGLLHIGSLLTALASYADAKSADGKWLVRMEDLDPPREMAGAADDILRTLEAFGFEWDGEVLYQSQRDEIYRAAWAELRDKDLIYPCFCSRKDWQAAATLGADGWVYNGHCRDLPKLANAENPAYLKQNNKMPAWRLRVPSAVYGFDDRIVGHYQQNLANEIGDFVLLRADGLWAYQLAVVVDDALQGVTHVVRGQDLLVSTPRQLFVQECLNLPPVSYAHLPLLVNRLGQKWSKQTLAPALKCEYRETLLRQVMAYLNVPSAPEGLNVAELLAWTVQHWDMARVGKNAICTE